jgi:hypothetical protein
VKSVIVLDKSYLQGSPPDTVKRLCAEYCVIMPGALFFELLTSSVPVRARCYAKFPDVVNPVQIVDHVGGLLNYESRSRRPAIPLYRHRERIAFRFNQKLALGTFELTAQQKRGEAKWRRQVASEADVHAAVCAVTHKWFPEIQGVSGRARPSAIAEARQAVAKDPSIVRERYGLIRRRSFPRESEIDSRWTFFRWMQVHLLSALRHIATHGIAAAPRNRQQLEHDVIDMQYQIMGILAGRIATRDGNIAKVVSDLEPKAEIVR